jgi:hypothetical protein
MTQVRPSFGCHATCRRRAWFGPWTPPAEVEANSGGTVATAAAVATGREPAPGAVTATRTGCVREAAVVVALVVALPKSATVWVALDAIVGTAPETAVVNVVAGD